MCSTRDPSRPAPSEGQPKWAVELARRMRDRPRPFRYIVMDGDGEITEMSEGPPAPPGAVNCILVTMPGEDGRHAHPADAEIEAAIARFVARGGVIRRQGDTR